MEALMSDLVKEMRIAMDEVKHDDDNDIFADDSDEEMKQAIEAAAQQILLQAPEAMLAPVIVKVSLGDEQDYDPIITQFTDGHGELTIPSDFVRLYELKLLVGNLVCVNLWIQPARKLKCKLADGLGEHHRSQKPC